MKHVCTSREGNEWVSKKIVIKVDNKEAWSRMIRLRKPNIYLELRVKEYPKTLGVGVTGKGVIEVIDRNSEVDPGLLHVIVNDVSYKIEMKKNEVKELEVMFKHGNNTIRLIRDNEVITEESIEITPIPPRISLKPESEFIIKYGMENEWIFDLEDNGVPYDIVSIEAFINDKRVGVSIKDGKIVVRHKVEKPEIEYVLNIIVKIKDRDDVEYDFTYRHILSLWVDKYGVVKEKITQLNERINYLRNKLDITPIIDLYQEYIGIKLACTELSDILETNICNEIENLDVIIYQKTNKLFIDSIYNGDLENAEKIYKIIESLCSNVVSPLCNEIKKYESLLKSLKEVFTVMEYIGLEELKIIDKIAILKDTLSICNELNISLPICSKIESRLAKLNFIYDRYVEAITELKAKLRKSIDSLELENAIKYLDKIFKLCEILGQEDPICKDLSGMNEDIMSIKQVLNNITVEPPSQASFDWFEVLMIVNNDCSRAIRGIIIDFEPAKEYFEMITYRINLPTIYPNTVLQHIIRLKPKYMGVLTVPYKICLGGYCIDKQFKVSIIPGHRPHQSIQREKEKIEKIDLKHDKQHIFTLTDFDGKPLDYFKGVFLSTIDIEALKEKLDINGYICKGVISRNRNNIILACIDGKNKELAIKIPYNVYTMLENGSSFTEKLSNEYLEYIDTLAKLGHPNIINYYKPSKYPDLNIPILVMDLCQYGDLGKLYHRYTEIFQNTKFVLELMIQVTSAISYLHKQKTPIVHGNLKLSNILLSKDYIIKITDIAIYKSVYFNPNTSTQQYFTAPEQQNHISAEITPATDVWALGSILYYLLTKRPPYPIFNRRPDYSRNPAPPSFDNDNIVKDLDRVILKALEQDPGNRFSDANELLNELIRIYNDFYRAEVL